MPDSFSGRWQLPVPRASAESAGLYASAGGEEEVISADPVSADPLSEILKEESRNGGRCWEEIDRVRKRMYDNLKQADGERRAGGKRWKRYRGISLESLYGTVSGNAQSAKGGAGSYEAGNPFNA